MSKLFHSSMLVRAWETPRDIALPFRAGDRKRLLGREINPQVSRLMPEEEGSLIEKKRKNAALIRCVKEETRAFSSMVSIPPHLFLLADQEAVVIFLQYPEYMEASLLEIGLQEGVSFSFNQLGVNGVSVAMERQRIAVVRGPEHDVQLFSDMNCLCMPIRVEGRAVGYLDLSFTHTLDVEFAVVLLCQLVGNIEKRLIEDNPQKKKELLFEAFEEFGLSSR